MLGRQVVLSRAQHSLQLQATLGSMCRRSAPMLRPAVRRRAGSAGRCRAETKLMQMVCCDDKEANWFAPKGGSVAAVGVVLFMQGFAQEPNAYYTYLQRLADAGFLVVAPVSEVAAAPKKQQKIMVDNARYFYNKIVSNSLPELPMNSSAVANRGLLGHSIGAGLATYVAKQAALHGKPFKAVMYMAPQISGWLLDSKYRPETAIKEWPRAAKTEFALQYGLKDGLGADEKSAHRIVTALRANKLSIKPENVVDYQNGTHVGFQDQVGWGKQGFLQVLPKLDPLLAGLLSALKDLRVPVLKFFPGLSEEFIKSIGAVVNPLDFALLEKQAASINQLPLAASELSQDCTTLNGIGDPVKVTLLTPDAAIARYTELVTVTGAVSLISAATAVYPKLPDPKDKEKRFFDGRRRLVLAALTVATAFMANKGSTYLALQKYVDQEQRPMAKHKAQEFFVEYLIKPYNR